MYRNLQFALEDTEPKAQSAFGGGSSLRSGDAFNALRTELSAPISQGLNAPSLPTRPAVGMDSPSVSAPVAPPIITTLRTPETAPVPTPVDTTLLAPSYAGAPASPPMTLSAPAPVSTRPDEATRTRGSVRRFKDFLAVNPNVSTGSAADLISAYQQWTGQQNWQGYQTPASAPSPSTIATPPSALSSVGPLGGAAFTPSSNFQNFYNTHGYYPGQGGH